MTKIINNKNTIYLIILLAAVLFFIGLGTRPFDGDEGIMVLIANNSWHDLLIRASQDVHPPLYHSLLKLSISGRINESSVRFLSALAGIGSVIFLYLFTKKLFYKDNHEKDIIRASEASRGFLYRISSELKNKIRIIPLTSVLLLTISSYLIYPVQETRMYSLFLFLVLGSYYFLLILIKRKSDWYKWTAYIIFSTLMLYTHYLGFIVLFSQIIYLAIFRKTKTKKWWRWIGSWMTVAVLFLPQLPTMLNQFSARVSEQSQALSIGNNIKGLIGAFYRFGSGRLFLNIDIEYLKVLISENPLLYLAFFITLLVPLWLFVQGLVIVYKKYKTQFWFLTIPAIIAITLSIFSNEIGSKTSRYLIYIFPFYLVFLSFGFLYYWKKRWTIIIPILFLAINVSGLIYHYVYENKAPGVNKIAEFVASKYQNGDSVLIRGGFGGGEEWVFRYYYNDTKISVPYVLEIYDMLGDYRAGNLAELKSIEPENKIKNLLQNHNRVFFYDMTYETDNIPGGIKNDLGYDKERKELIVWEVGK